MRYQVIISVRWITTKKTCDLCKTNFCHEKLDPLRQFTQYDAHVFWAWEHINFGDNESWVKAESAIGKTLQESRIKNEVSTWLHKAF